MSINRKRGNLAYAKEWKWGYITPQGDFAIPPRFDGASDFHDGLAPVKIEWKRGYIDKEGEFFEKEMPASEPLFETGFDPHYELHDGLVRFVDNEKFGYKDKDGNVVIKPQYFEATDFSEGLACVKKGKTGSWGYIDKAGKTVIPAQFKQAKPFHEGLAAVLTRE